MKKKILIVGSLPGKILESLKESMPEEEITVVESASEVKKLTDYTRFVSSPRLIKPMDKSIIEHIAQHEWQFNNRSKKGHKRDYKYHK